MGAIIDKKVVFAGCAKNCAAFLPQVRENVDRIADLFAEVAFIFVENDSKDATKNQLRDWCDARPSSRLITRDGFDRSYPIRTIRLGKLRTEYVALVKAEFSEHDYLVVLDCDEVNVSMIDLDAVVRAIDFLAQDPSRAGVFANVEGLYYDMWALRHPQLCPGDVWEEVLDYVTRFGVSDQEAYSQTLKLRGLNLKRNAPPLEVDSAFGGLAIYKIASILNNQASFIGYKKKILPSRNGPTEVGLQVCEHVSFNAGFRALGEKLFILPYLINFQCQAGSFPPSGFRTKIFDLRRAKTNCQS